MKEEVKTVYQVVKYRLLDGESDVIKVGMTFSEDYTAVESILRYLSTYKDGEVEFYDYEDDDEELTWLFDDSIYVKKIASYEFCKGVTHCYGIYAIVLE